MGARRPHVPWLADAGKRDRRVHFLLSRKEAAWLDAIAKRDGITASDVLRRGIWDEIRLVCTLKRVQRGMRRR